MCGIAGIIGNGLGDKRRVIAGMLAAMKHRGPDHTDVKEFLQYGILGHNRLSIIDPVPSSHQPFVSDDGRYTIIFNGEVYNYLELKKELEGEFVFRTHSDTEVLLNAYRKWGATCLDRLIGMFAFAVWDDEQKILFAARDRFGVKPFYYAVYNHTFIFGSEIKALWAAGLPKEADYKVWSSFLSYGSYGMPGETFWKNVAQLPGGTYLILKDGRPRVYQWYDFEGHVKKAQAEWLDKTEEVIMDRYLELLRESIRFRFRSDVPVGFNVSGGLDSSLLLSLIKETFPDGESIRAFTFYTGNADYDELPWVKALMETTRYPLLEVLLTPEMVPALTEEVSRVQDEPFGGIPTLAYSQLFREARRKNDIVLLDGQGIDEAWAGYDYYGKNTGDIVQGVNSSPVRPHVLTEELGRLAETPAYPRPFDTPLLNTQYRDLFFTKIPRALRFNDRVSMMYSTELREPFLDHRLVEMAFALPAQWKIREGTGKYLLRKMTQKLLPDSIRYAPKRALQTPQREWLGGELRDWTDQCVRSFAAHPGIDGRAVLREWRDYTERGGDNSFYIWQWISFSYLLKNDAVFTL